MSASIAGSSWLADDRLQSLLSLLNERGEQARIAGGAVRNALLGEPVSDIDIATTCTPDQVIRRAERAEMKTVPTGVEHGTVTVVVAGHPFEVTTLREDVETDGRHATVRFGRDWRADADRRDFTINGLFAEADGTVIDLVGGVTDIENRVLRFIGDPETRIREDYLRILRFFRFFAWYGDGRPDAEGLKACARLKGGLEGLSAERVWAELKKLLAAPDPSRALLWMRQAGVLSLVLPESEKWGIDAIHGLVATEKALDWMPEAPTRLIAIIPPDAAKAEAMAVRLRFSKAEQDRLTNWAGADAIAHNLSEAAFEKTLYRGDVTAVVDLLRLALVSARTRGETDDQALVEAGGYGKLLAIAENWKKPKFPISGKGLLEIGVEPGTSMGALLEQLEDEWVDAGFAPDRKALLARARELTAESGGNS